MRQVQHTKQRTWLSMNDALEKSAVADEFHEATNATTGLQSIYSKDNRTKWQIHEQLNRQAAGAALLI
jgi:hypothetical protein